MSGSRFEKKKNKKRPVERHARDVSPLTPPRRRVFSPPRRRARDDTPPRRRLRDDTPSPKTRQYENYPENYETRNETSKNLKWADMSNDELSEDDL